MEGQDLSVSFYLDKTFAPRQPIDFWYDLLLSVAKEIGLTPLSPPLIFDFSADYVPTETGASGIMLIIQSHIAFHWWPETSFLHLTISSCKSFDQSSVLSFLLERFVMVKKFVMRDTKWL